jgi:hypothetical protein
MGWKLSMIIIQNPQNFRNEELLLEKLGFKDFEYQGDTTLDECMYTGDNSVNIGYYNGNIIICEDYQVIDNFFTYKLTEIERKVIEIFPKSEILAVCCVSATNFHGYSLTKNGIKIRFKSIGAEEDLKEYGEPLEEEKEIYNKAIIKNGERIWIFPDMPNEEFKEDQLMEEFTFSMIKRQLGVDISEIENEELLNNTVFRKYHKKSIWNKIRKWF